MNIVAFPIKDMDIAILKQIIRGGVQKLTEAQVALIGGHSIEDKEIKYGLSVTGFIHPERILAKKNLRSEDHLILTKPIGTGIVNTAIKAAMASKELSDRATHLMATLNRDAASIIQDFDISACTDITGFGLLGHIAEMVSGSGKSVRICSVDVPVITGALDFASIGLIPAGAYKNREFRGNMIIFSKTVPRALQDVLFDPQTSGGLLVSVINNQSEALLDALKKAGIHDAAKIGEIIRDPDEKIFVV